MRIDMDAPQSGGKKGRIPRYRTGSMPLVVMVLLEYAIKLSSLVFLLTLGYVGYGIYAIPSEPLASLPVADQARIIGNFSVALRILTWAGAIIALGLALRFYYEEVTGYLLALFGALAFWGIPSVMHILLPPQSVEISPLFIQAAQIIGFACLVPGTLVIFYDMGFRIREAWSGRRSRVVSVPKDDDWHPKEAKIPIRCWQTSFCRPYVRDLCPRYKERTPCWRKKEGCYCEEKIILRAIELKQGGGDFFTKMRQSLAGTQAPIKSLTPKQKRERCRRCPIYSQHQRLKYKILAPLTFPVVFIFLWLTSGRIREILETAVSRTDELVSILSFRVTQGAGAVAGNESAVQGLEQVLSSNIIFWGVMVFLYVMLLTWLLRLVEWLILKVQV